MPRQNYWPLRIFRHLTLTPARPAQRIQQTVERPGLIPHPSNPAASPAHRTLTARPNTMPSVRVYMGPVSFRIFSAKSMRRCAFSLFLPFVAIRTLFAARVNAATASSTGPFPPIASS